ncbi:hypothetical protein [Austwickia sp. TVS 96-490-7B]|uniref:hypothetical protein n=1 Tax=Austwickia sp. TVS 96-490-7B TaxID=2830843 RepID=UPI001C56C90B|nr:hypothetical protein [Austwickia sp. TVS 96-490-7B]
MIRPNDQERSVQASRLPRGRTARTVLSAGGALATALLLSACQWTSPITTQLSYTPADGSQVDIGSLHIRNALVVASKEGAPGTLVATIANTDTNTTGHLMFRIGQESLPAVEVPARQSVRLGAGESARPAVIGKVPAAPGAMMNISLISEGGLVTELSVPILAPNGPYATLTPTATPSASGPTGGTAAPTGTASPTPSTSSTAPSTAPGTSPSPAPTESASPAPNATSAH